MTGLLPNGAFKPTAYIVPVVLAKLRPDQQFEPVEMLGTAFVLAPGLVVTCYHCVRDDPPPGHVYVIASRPDGAAFKAHVLNDIERDTNGTDIATARCDYLPPAIFTLAAEDMTYGQWAWTFGYPWAERRQGYAGEVAHVFNGRLLRGYLTRHCFHEVRGQGRIPVYELDMLAPKGASGGPLFINDSRIIAGVVIGTNDIETVEEFASVDPKTGHRQPETVRMASLAIAHDTATLRKVTTLATGGRPLAEFLADQH